MCVHVYAYLAKKMRGRGENELEYKVVRLSGEHLILIIRSQHYMILASTEEGNFWRPLNSPLNQESQSLKPL